MDTTKRLYKNKMTKAIKVDKCPQQRRVSPDIDRLFFSEAIRVMQAIPRHRPTGEN